MVLLGRRALLAALTLGLCSEAVTTYKVHRLVQFDHDSVPYGSRKKFVNNIGAFAPSPSRLACRPLACA